MALERSSLADPGLDLTAIVDARRANLRATMVAHGVDLAVLTNPISIRYATGYRGYATFQTHIPSAYLMLPVEGPTILHGAYTDELDCIDWCEVSHAVTTFDAGIDPANAAKRFADDIERALDHAGLGRTASVGIERTTPTGFGGLTDAGLNIVDVEHTVELARSRKVAGEIPAMRYAIAVAQLAMWRMHDALVPGITENELFAILHATNVAHDGDWIDGRMLCSGPRTNPWYQEASGRVIEAGDMVAFDTDMIGPHGYCADISRTWVCGAEPTAQQRELYRRALDEIEHNQELLRVGASFAELSQASFRQPHEFVANRYACVFHGVGMSDEYPKIPYPDDWHWTGYDGELEAGTVLSVESYVGADDGTEGVKLEQMVQVTEAGVVPLSDFPLLDI